MRYIVDVALSPELQVRRREQHQAGRKLPSKGTGLAPISSTVCNILKVQDWPSCLLTSAAFYGSFYVNMLIGAHDSETLYSNYFLQTELANPHARKTPGGRERRDVAELALVYIRHKDQLEKKYTMHLAGRTARLLREKFLAIMLYEAAILGMLAEAIARGYDPATTAIHFILSSPGTNIIDVGSDINNSELFNSLLNTADITDSGIVTEEALRNVYDAYAHCMAPMYTVQTEYCGSRLCAILLSWHMQNGRHHFLRRALLGWPKARKDTIDQREADLDEAFDERMHTTGFSRPLHNARDGKIICNQEPMLKNIWYYFIEAPLEYVSKGGVDEHQEEILVEGSRVAMARAASYGLINEMAWLLCHVNLHATQVNRLTEAAMFGSLLDDGALMGRLDRIAYDGDSIHLSRVEL
ncbi:hypothetical protein BJX96DRAFT_182195 [Aspergillus floccosus]